jgi:hypothetical protein
MGSSHSTTTDPLDFRPDLSNATLPVSDYQHQLTEFRERAHDVAQSKVKYKLAAWGFGILIALGIVIILILLIHDGFAIAFDWPNTYLLHRSNEKF